MRAIPWGELYEDEVGAQLTEAAKVRVRNLCTELAAVCAH